jgi:hypothetical protein
MASKTVRKSTAAKPRSPSPRAAANGKQSASTTHKVAPGTAHKAVLAGIGAASRLQEEAVKVYGLLASEAQRLSVMTSEAADTLAKKAGVYVREGRKVQSATAADAQAKAIATAREVKAFAQKSELAIKQNLERGVNRTVSGAKQGVTQLEHVFESRVAKTLNTFGMPSSHDVRALQARMAELQKALNQLNRRGV